MSRFGIAFACQGLLLAVASAAEPEVRLPIRITWGHGSPAETPFHVALTGEDLGISDPRGVGLEDGESACDGAWTTHAGGGDVDGVACAIACDAKTIAPSDKIHGFWKAYLEMSDRETKARILQDRAARPDGRILTVQMDREGTRGFSVTVDQMLAQKAFWIPSLDVYLAAGDAAPSFEEHRKALESKRGARILDRIRGEPEATYAQYTDRWEDMGSPSYTHPSQPAPGHIVCLTWDSALYKFGIDRGAGVWNDYGNPDRFRFWFDIGELSERLRESWKGQRLEDGFPVISTAIERDGFRYEIGEFAYPLNGPPKGRRGDIPMVLLQRIRVANLEDRGKSFSIRVHHRRAFPPDDASQIACRPQDEAFLFEEGGSRRILFAVQGADLRIESAATRDDPPKEGKKQELRWKAIEAEVKGQIGAKGRCEFIVKLPSPPVAANDRDTLLALDYAACRAATREFWSEWEARGARIRTPEKVVNDLIRANLWHALRLPRRHGGPEKGVAIDLPYSNFAYDQRGAPWPVNQAIYVDYMIHDLRGYTDVSAEELLVMFRGNQQPDGRVAGYANWGVYTPSMIYATAKNFLLSGDRAVFDGLLPYALKALDWCLGEVRRSRERSGPASGLVRAPLNDGTGDGVWAFTQGYVYAGLKLLGKALEEIGHPRAGECLEAAREFRRSVERAFGAASMRSALVPLRDGTWIPYVPCEATESSRLLDQWYPTDVDTGAVHLLRLEALPADGLPADSLLHDHEDNLYLHGWGMANEPVYNPQATAYLLRDEPEASVRAFYSFMACAFSHSALEPVEHRWTWGQYFGPPSTDGAWFEHLRNMMIRELDDGTLFLLQSVPRAWLRDGKRIEIERAPTYFGPISFATDSRASAGRLAATIEMPKRHRPSRLLVRFRHPDGARIRAASVDGKDWKEFDPEKEWVAIDSPAEARYEIIAEYPAQVAIALDEKLGPMEIDKMALGQGGLSEEPMWDDRIAEVRALRPRIIRIFIQEYFDLLPEAGQYHFDALDRSIDTILQAGAKPLMCICFKPKVLFPKVDQDIVEPNDYAAWEELIFRLVEHYKTRGAGIQYWEVSNEPDIGEDGGCPYRFKPESYVRYYGHTARAILRADPDARVGGPALAGVRSPILPALLAAAQAGEVPLHFVSWHIYSSDPRAVRGTIEHARGLLAGHPAVKVETFLDEWNMDLSPEPKDPRFQPPYVAETIRQMKDAGLDYSCYYHIRDYHISPERFAPFMSPRGAAFMEKWWNRRPQVDGLFDYQGTVRPTYFLFKLLSRLTGERLRVTSMDGAIQGLASWDERLGLYNILLWNFSAEPREIDVALRGAPGDLRAWPIVLNTAGPSDDENARLRPEHSFPLPRDRATMEARLAAYEVRFWSLERK